MHANFDVAVVGAGIVGLWSAFHLADRGLRVGVLEQTPQPGGATAHSGAGVRFFDEDPRVSEEIAVSQRYYEQLAGTTFTRCPCVYCPAPESMAAQASSAAARGFAVADRAALRKRWPDLCWDGVALAVLDERAGYWDPVAVMDRLRAACVHKGVRFHYGQRLAGVEDAGTPRLHTLDGTWHAGQVIFATGYWTAALLRQLGQPVQVTSRTITIHLLAAHNVPAPPFLVEQDSGFHMRAAARGNVLFGLPQLDWDIDPDALPASSAAHFQDALGRLQRYCLAPVTYRQVRTVRSADAYSHDGGQQPGALPPSMHVFAFGNGASFKTAPSRTLTLVNSLFG